MCTKDKDLDQLIDSQVVMYDIQTNEELDAAGLVAKKGYSPTQARDVLALTGDSVDNLPGIPGVGPKTAACVLMFALGRPAMPVDTHVHRVSRRLGLIPDRMSAEAAPAALEAITPPDDIYSLHICLIRHGRRVCRAPTPHCPACAARDLCPFPAKTKD